MNFENLWLLALLPLIILFTYILIRRGKKNYFIHPWAQQIYVRSGSGKFRSHFTLVLLLVSVLAVAIVVAKPWQGMNENEQTEEARMISVEIDVSGSMWGKPDEAAVNASKYLIDKRPRDRVNLVFFASESVATSFGVR